MHKARVVVLGAGFAGLEIVTVFRDAMGDDVDVTLIDKNDITAVDLDRRRVTAGGKTYDADFLVIALGEAGLPVEYPGVYAVGDCADTARSVASDIVAKLRPGL